MSNSEGTSALVLAPEDMAAIRAIIAGMEASWNAGDGKGYGAFFAPDADFVIVDGRQIQGRATIAAGHQGLFDTVYRNSRNSGTVEDVRLIRDGVAVAHAQWRLRVRDGENEHEGAARSTLVLTKEPAGWQIAAFHNTPLVGDGMARPGAMRP